MYWKEKKEGSVYQNKKIDQLVQSPALQELQNLKTYYYYTQGQMFLFKIQRTQKYQCHPAAAKQQHTDHHASKKNLISLPSEKKGISASWPVVIVPCQNGDGGMATVEIFCFQAFLGFCFRGYFDPKANAAKKGREQETAVGFALPKRPDVFVIRINSSGTRIVSLSKEHRLKN